MQICWPWIFGKRRHSGEMLVKSQLISHFFLVLLRHCPSLLGLTDKKIKKNQQRKRFRSKKTLGETILSQESGPNGQNLYFSAKKAGHN
ncbi:hypothetical protein [Kosakonia arachidis]|uniref:hypothetical protein n=1 Tax=Kosakonia arachidis TaxID=551989 RepID=UPI000B7D045D|nr:hypothetical protein [Kosakonia arachidis]